MLGKARKLLLARMVDFRTIGLLTRPDESLSADRPLFREAGHVYVTNVDYYGLSEGSSFSLRRLKE